LGRSIRVRDPKEPRTGRCGDGIQPRNGLVTQSNHLLDSLISQSYTLCMTRGQRRWKELSPEEKKKVIEQHKAYRRANKEKVNAWVNAYNASRPEEKRRSARETQRKRRRQILVHYGGKCACCGEKRFEFLQISHKHQNGVPSARRVGGTSQVVNIIIRTWPKNIQVLCANCHQALDLWGFCPHKKPHKTTPL